MLQRTLAAINDMTGQNRLIVCKEPAALPLYERPGRTACVVLVFIPRLES